MICCLCCLEAGDLIGISKEGKVLNIAEIIYKHFSFTDQKDILSSCICTICWSKTNDFHEFYASVEKSYRDYQNMKQDLVLVKEEDNFQNTNDIKQEEEMDDKKYDKVHRELQCEIEIDFDDPSCTKNPLAENESGCGDSEYECSDDDGIISRSSYEKQTKKHKRAKKSATKKVIKNKLKTYRGKNIIITKSENNTEPKRKKAAFNRLDPLHTEQMIRKHIPMGCNLCVFVGETFAEIVSHFKVNHSNIRPYITCCDRTFTKRFYIAQHAMTHENPTCFSCVLCNKSFTTTGGLQKHNLKYHAPDEELIFACDLCPQKFARQHFLQLHKPSHIPRDEWKFFCIKCPTTKSFASPYLLNIHDNKLHKREKNICSVCAKEIKDKKSFEKHVREHYEGSGPKIKCPFPDCESWLKDEDNLKLHLRRHNTDGATHKCPLCDKIYPNRRALASHKVYVHTKQVFKCKQCDKSFKRAINLREHMTQHTGEVLYNCPFCTKTFNSNANMHSHKKKQHPVEWEALRRQKMGNNLSETFPDISTIC